MMMINWILCAISRTGCCWWQLGRWGGLDQYLHHLRRSASVFVKDCRAVCVCVRAHAKPAGWGSGCRPDCRKRDSQPRGQRPGATALAGSRLSRRRPTRPHKCYYTFHTTTTPSPSASAHARLCPVHRANALCNHWIQGSMLGVFIFFA